MSDIFSIGVSALNAAQAGIVVTGNNIANANTPGYSRQQIVQTSNIPQGTGAGFFGQGVHVQTVKRLYNDFLTSQVNQAQTQSSYLSTYSTQINQIDNLLGNSGLGLAPAIQGFFSAVQGVANNPSSVPSRQAMLSASQAMVSTFQNIDAQLVSQRTGVNSQITNSVALVNSYAQQIAQLNQTILAAQGAANGQPPNDLLDQRDQLVAQLSKEIQTTVVKQSDGTYNVLIGNGQSLVVGNQVTNLVATPNPSDPSNTEVGYTSGNTTNLLPESSIVGGNLGAFMTFRSQSLNVAQDALGRIAIGLAKDFNTQQQLGQDLNGNLGQAYFNVPSAGVYPDPANGTGAAANATLTTATATTSMSIAANLSSASTQPATSPFNPQDPTSYNFTTSGTVYDSLGNSHTASEYFVKTATPDQWLAYAYVDGSSADSAQTSATVTSAVTTAATSSGATASDAATIAAAAVTAASATGATAATVAAAVSAEATALGYSAAQASGMATLTTSAGVAAIGSPNPSVINFTAAGAYSSATNLTKSATLSNGAAPLAFNMNFSQMTETAAASSFSSITQNGTTGVNQLTGSDYVLKYNGTSWSLTNSTTNQSVTMTGAGTAASPFIADGMSLVVSAPTSGTASFIIKPTINGAGQISVAMSDPTLIAAASPIKTSPALNPDGTSKNTGSGVISAGVVNPPLSANLQDNVTITFNNPPTTFNVQDTTTNTTLASNVSYTAGNPISYNGWTVSVTGSPNAGDSFTVARNSGAVSDNSNALLLAGLQTANTLQGGTTSFEGAYSQLVAQVGTTASQMQVTSTAQTSMVNQLTQQQQSVAGVNLDEEAANLMRYQQAYQAAGKMMQIASTLFQSILQI